GRASTGTRRLRRPFCCYVRTTRRDAGIILRGRHLRLQQGSPREPKEMDRSLRFCNGVPLNESNPDELVNVLEYWEIHPDGKVQHFSWITDFLLIPENVWDIMRGGRARWKIENETFNTLKNQGYHLEHNYGHGEQNLSVVLALLMMLAFLVDQVQQLCCPLFQAAWHKMKTKC